MFHCHGDHIEKDEYYNRQLKLRTHGNIKKESLYFILKSNVGGFQSFDKNITESLMVKFTKIMVIITTIMR